jgi:hypothetical protein
MPACAALLAFRKRAMKGSGLVPKAPRPALHRAVGCTASPVCLDRRTWHSADQGRDTQRENDRLHHFLLQWLGNFACIVLAIAARSRSAEYFNATPCSICQWRACRLPPAARLVDGADEVHKMVLAKFMREEGRDFWMWSAGNRV